MRTTRVIPCLLLDNGGLVKTVRFSRPTYIGDPINAVKIFNEMEADELIFLDIHATDERRPPSFQLIEEIASEAFMPVCYGGGVRSIETMRTIYRLGVEKIAVNAAAVEDASFLRTAADTFGSQSIVASIDVQRTMSGRTYVCTHSGHRKTGLDPLEHARNVERMGAGEIMITAVHRDGMMTGYDIPLIKSITEAVSLPVIACGGAGTLSHFTEAVEAGGASAVAAGSMFVYFGRIRGILINYPRPGKLEECLP